MDDTPMQSIAFEVAYSGTKYAVLLPPTSTVAELKDEVEQLTSISAAGQKLVGLPKTANDETVLSTLALKKPAKLILMGTPDAELAKFRAASTAAQEAASSDADADGEDGGSDEEDDSGKAVHTQALHLSRIQRRITAYAGKAVVHAGFRPGKLKLVLDVDYTLMDHKSPAERPSDMARPYLQEFLTAMYEHYDLIIWSATSMKWIELKMAELGLASHSAFKLAGYIDYYAMITVNCPDRGPVDVKPLGVLWGLFPEHCSPSNTVHVDDLRRNFLMNPRHGIRLKPCRHLPVTRDSDDELKHVGAYLALIAKDVTDLSTLNHRKWRRYLEAHRHGQGAGAGAGAGAGTGPR